MSAPPGAGWASLTRVCAPTGHATAQRPNANAILRNMRSPLGCWTTQICGARYRFHIFESVEIAVSADNACGPPEGARGIIDSGRKSRLAEQTSPQRGAGGL